MGMSGPSQSGGGGRRRGRRTPMAEINVTPLVDVMLVLLIIFMVTAPLLTSGVSVKLPENRAKALDQDQKPKTISIDADGRIYIDDIETTQADLPQRLDELRNSVGAEEPPQIYLRADTAIDYGRVSFVLGELNRAGLNKVALVSSSASEVSARSDPGE
ncbi:MAG: ExbD/TolR family protein [Sphingobium sp.]|nr:ExbD/TolR family protein [Sphingobium sp.]